MKRLKTMKTAAMTAYYTVTILGAAAKVRKDFTAHAKHEEHSPCPCGEQCLGCLFKS